MKKVLAVVLTASMFLTSASAIGFKDLAKKAAEKAIGIETKEVVGLDSEHALYCFLKGTKFDLSEEYINYAKVVEKDTYNKYHNDEFEWNEQFAKIKKNFDKKVELADLTKEYKIRTSVNFGDYNFDEKAYPIDYEFGESTIIPLDTVFSYLCSNTGTPANNSIFCKKFAFYLLDLSKYNFLPMEQKKAKTFLQGRKSSGGNINRKIDLVITYKLVDFDSDDFKIVEEAAEKERYIPLVGTILKIEAFDMSDSDNVRKIGELIKK